MVNTRFCISCKWALCSLAQGRMIFWYGRYRARQLVVAMTVTGLFWLEPESTSPNKPPGLMWVMATLAPSGVFFTAVMLPSSKMPTSRVSYPVSSKISSRA